LGSRLTTITVIAHDGAAVSTDGFIGDPSGEAEFFTRFVDAEFLESVRAFGNGALVRRYARKR
jgi:hypothetical protein